jgi:hypothetical protein
MDADSVLYIAGDAADENNLIKAGIERAKAVVAALATDTDNVFLVLTARQLAPELLIMARSSQDTAKIKLRAKPGHGKNQVARRRCGLCGITLCNGSGEHGPSHYPPDSDVISGSGLRPQAPGYPDGRNSGEPFV